MKLRRRRGFSFVEVMVGTFVLSILGLGIAGMHGSVEKTLGTDTRRMDASARATRALEQATRQLRSATLSSFRTLPTGFQTWQTPTNGVVMDDLQFQALIYDPEDPDSLPTASDTFTLQVVASSGDPVNGEDDDNDGAVDSRSLVLVRPDLPDVVILDHVSSCEFELEDRTLEIRAIVSLRTPTGVTILERATASVEIRND
jgi:prepilin-type N-terminal cleavage/methylation domain-containing protein